MEASLGTGLPFERVEFAAEWEARLFAMVATLVAKEVFDWPDFRAHLVRHNHSTTDTDLSLWAHALRSLLHERGLLP